MNLDLVAFLLETKSTDESVNQIAVLFTQHRAGARLALQRFWPALSSPCSPASCGYLLSGQGSREIEVSLFTGQAQIRFLTAPPERLCQGKLALQNCSLTGKCVSLFISHSHWKKGGVGEWLVMMSFFPRNFSKASRFTATSGTACVLLRSAEQNWPRARSFSSFSHPSASSPHLFWGFYSLKRFASGPEKEAGVREVWESCASISCQGDLNLGGQLPVHGDGRQVLALGLEGREALPGESLLLPDTSGAGNKG